MSRPTPDEIEKWKARRQDGWTIRQIAAEYGWSTEAVRTCLDGTAAPTDCQTCIATRAKFAAANKVVCAGLALRRARLDFGRAAPAVNVAQQKLDAAIADYVAAHGEEAPLG